MGGADCLLGSVGVLNGSTFFLFVTLTAIVMTKTKVTMNGIQVVWWQWLAWFGARDAVVAILLTVSTMSTAVSAMHFFCTVCANMSIIATLSAGEGRLKSHSLCSCWWRRRVFHSWLFNMGLAGGR